MRIVLRKLELVLCHNVCVLVEYNEPHGAEDVRVIACELTIALVCYSRCSTIKRAYELPLLQSTVARRHDALP